jgi:hypothetical protein
MGDSNSLINKSRKFSQDKLYHVLRSYIQGLFSGFLFFYKHINFQSLYPYTLKSSRHKGKES